MSLLFLRVFVGEGANQPRSSPCWRNCVDLFRSCNRLVSLLQLHSYKVKFVSSPPHRALHQSLFIAGLQGITHMSTLAGWGLVHAEVPCSFPGTSQTPFSARRGEPPQSREKIIGELLPSENVRNMCGRPTLQIMQKGMLNLS